MRIQFLFSKYDRRRLLFILAASLLFFAGCGTDANSAGSGSTAVADNTAAPQASEPQQDCVAVTLQPSFSGTVTAVSEACIQVSVDPASDAYKSADLIDVQTTTMIDEDADFAVGDAVRVYYDGTIVESDPAQLATVYAIIKE